MNQERKKVLIIVPMEAKRNLAKKEADDVEYSLSRIEEEIRQEEVAEILEILTELGLIYGPVRARLIASQKVDSLVVQVDGEQYSMKENNSELISRIFLN